jgi:ATP-dependent RNA helicase DOB1
MVVDDKGKFHEQNFNKAMETMGESIGVIGIDTKKNNKKKVNQGSDLFKIIKLIMEQNLDPVIIFSFSKKDVESYAKSVCTKYDLTTKDEKERIEQVFNNAIDILSEEDKNLPQLKAMKEIIKKGIGIHHGGLLPLLKEVVELLFQDSLLKVLFST